jgi:phage shock protein A
MTTALVALIVVVIALVIVNSGAMAKIFGASRAQVGKLGRMAEEADPLALLNQAVEDGVNSIQNSKKGLENYRALILSVQRQVDSGEKERARLELRIQAALASGDANHTAEESAMVLADVERHLAANCEQLARHMEIYENFAQQVELGQAKVAEARLKAARLGLELEQSRREKEMAKFASDFSFDPQGLHSDLARAEELINRKIDANRAVGEVAADMSKQTLINADADEAERKAAAAEILNRFGRKALTSDKPNP